MKKSELIQELGLEILDILGKERKDRKGELHPMNMQFRSDEDVGFKEGAYAQAHDTYLKVYSALNSKYNQELIKEKDDTTN
jgi:hypothetical protein